MKIELVNIAVAKLLKDIGFNETTYYFYDKNNKIHFSKNTNNILSFDNYSCPTINEAIIWVINNTDITPEIIPIFDKNNGCIKYGYRILTKDDFYEGRNVDLNKNIYEFEYQASNDSLIECIEKYKYQKSNIK